MNAGAGVADGPRVLSVYEGFFAGGARVLHTAVVRSLEATTGQRHAVLSLTDRSVRESTIQHARHDASHRRLVAAGIAVTTLDRESGDALRPRHLRTMSRMVSEADVVLSLKEQPLSALARIEPFGPPVLTTLHRSDPEHQGAALADLVDAMDRGVVTAAICCARSTQAAYHAATGIALDRLPVVANGVDLHRFRADPAARHDVRRALGVRGDAPVVLLAARFDPMKDVPLFVRAVAELVRARPDAHVVLCGAGMDVDNAALRDLLGALERWDEAHRHLHLLGIREDMPRLYNAADLVVLTSAWGEAAPLSLFEGMACGAVPVTTDVGDAAAMVGDPRLVVGRDPVDVAAAWLAAFEQREEHAERIWSRRQSLSDQRCFDSYAALISAHVASRTLPLAV